jgi:hypothetical protein
MMQHYTNRKLTSAYTPVHIHVLPPSPAVTYNEGFLEQENAAYCKWITDMSHWGGPIELSILAAHYGCQLAAYDIQTKRCDVYGQVRPSAAELDDGCLRWFGWWKYGRLGDNVPGRGGAGGSG